MLIIYLVSILKDSYLLKKIEILCIINYTYTTRKLQAMSLLYDIPSEFNPLRESLINTMLWRSVNDKPIKDSIKVIKTHVDWYLEFAQDIPATIQQLTKSADIDLNVKISMIRHIQTRAKYMNELTTIVQEIIDTYDKRTATNPVIETILFVSQDYINLTLQGIIKDN